MKNFFVLITVLVAIHAAALAQPGITIGQVTNVVPGTNAFVPVTINNFYWDFGLCCTVTYDPLVLTYNGHVNVNPAFQQAVLVTNGVNGNLQICWFSLDSINYPTGQIFDLSFHFIAGTSLLTWDTACLNSMGLTGVNGLVTMTTGITPEKELNSLVQVTPNPVTDKLLISTPIIQSQVNRAEIYNIAGQLVIGPVNLEDNKTMIDVTTLETGLYFIQIQHDKGIITQKLVKQ